MPRCSRVVQRHVLPDRVAELLRHLVVAHAEVPEDGHDAGHRGHGQLALVRLAEPALLRKLLDDPRPLSLRVVPAQRRPGVQHEHQDRRQEDGEEDQLGLPLQAAAGGLRYRLGHADSRRVGTARKGTPGIPPGDSVSGRAATAFRLKTNPRPRETIHPESTASFPKRHDTSNRADDGQRRSAAARGGARRRHRCRCAPGCRSTRLRRNRRTRRRPTPTRPNTRGNRQPPHLGRREEGPVAGEAVHPEGPWSADEPEVELVAAARDRSATPRFRARAPANSSRDSMPPWCSAPCRPSRSRPP